MEHSQLLRVCIRCKEQKSRQPRQEWTARQGMETGSGGGALTGSLEKEESREGGRTIFFFYYVSAFASVVKKLVMGLDKWVSSYEHLKILQKNRFLFLPPTWWLTTIHSSYRESNILNSVGTRKAHGTYIYRQAKHSHI